LQSARAGDRMDELRNGRLRRESGLRVLEQLGKRSSGLLKPKEAVCVVRGASAVLLGEKA
jgi:hypothetical protein